MADNTTEKKTVAKTPAAKTPAAKEKKAKNNPKFRVRNRDGGSVVIVDKIDGKKHTHLSWRDFTDEEL